MRGCECVEANSHKFSMTVAYRNHIIASFMTIHARNFYGLSNFINIPKFVPAIKPKVD